MKVRFGSRPGRADSGYGYVGCPPIPTGSCVAIKCRDMRQGDIADLTCCQTGPLTEAAALANMSGEVEMIISATTFLYAQPEDVQYFVAGAVQAHGDAFQAHGDAFKEIKRVYGDKYSNEEIEALIHGARIALR